MMMLFVAALSGSESGENTIKDTEDEEDEDTNGRNYLTEYFVNLPKFPFHDGETMEQNFDINCAKPYMWKRYKGCQSINQSIKLP